MIPKIDRKRGLEMHALLENIDRLHTTELGEARIRRNLQMETEDVVQWCKTRILGENVSVERIGKNWYAAAGGYRITVHAHCYTIITAHRIKL